MAKGNVLKKQKMRKICPIAKIHPPAKCDDCTFDHRKTVESRETSYVCLELVFYLKGQGR